MIIPELIDRIERILIDGYQRFYPDYIALTSYVNPRITEIHSEFEEHLEGFQRDNLLIGRTPEKVDDLMKAQRDTYELEFNRAVQRAKERVKPYLINKFRSRPDDFRLRLKPAGRSSFDINWTKPEIKQIYKEGIAKAERERRASLVDIKKNEELLKSRPEEVERREQRILDETIRRKKKEKGREDPTAYRRFAAERSLIKKIKQDREDRRVDKQLEKIFSGRYRPISKLQKKLKKSGRLYDPELKDADFLSALKTYEEPEEEEEDSDEGEESEEGAGKYGGRVGRRRPFNFIQTGKDFINENRETLVDILGDSYNDYFPDNFESFINRLYEFMSHFTGRLNDYILRKLELQPREEQERIKREYDFNPETNFFDYLLGFTPINTHLERTLKDIIITEIREGFINFYADNPDLEIIDRFNDPRASDFDGVNWNINFTRENIDEIERARGIPARGRMGAVAEDPRGLEPIPEEEEESEESEEGAGKMKSYVRKLLGKGLYNMTYKGGARKKKIDFEIPDYTEFMKGGKKNKKPLRKSKGGMSRGKKVAMLMKEHGLTLPQASKMLKEMEK